jgi:hypothetical protein
MANNSPLVASVTQPVNSYTQPDLWVVDVTPNAKPRNLTDKFDFDIGDGPFGMARAARRRAEHSDLDTGWA